MARRIAGYLRGTYAVRRNLKRVMGRKIQASMAGLIEAAANIRLSMDTTPPLIPVKTGALRESWYVIPISLPNDKNPSIQMGFSALYAIFVHEIDWREGTRPGSGPKFFQSALNRNRRQTRNIIARHVRAAR